MGTYVFPTRLFRPSSLQARLLGAAVAGGASLAGETQFAELSGGGRWAIDFGETTMWRPALVKPWRALAAVADSGATQILVPLADRLYQPLTSPLVTPDTFGLSIYDDGLTPWSPDQVTATLSASAALGQTEISFNLTSPVPVTGGEHFSVHHPIWGWRLYRIIRVKSGGLGTGDETVCDIRPPLREAVGTGDSPPVLLNFDSPRCLMRVDGDMDLQLDLQRFGHASAKFVEAGKPT